ncbi:hypothetical protein GR212_15200 [Rhizobium lusitanum]|uniref:Uncharacterized protein n=1 Tax=Rhizobium lusitanum TaxID=293958 RepID=A0A6L9U696_9HYPH|nr:hypothetical protein [Rhizobium lusitanum]NEI70929.1 hypothetical protein [Rhizobium lusitanum]
MPFRKYAATPLDPHFRENLFRFARKQVCSDLAANRVVQRTIEVLCHEPELLDGRDVNETIFALLRRHAFEETNLLASRTSKNSRYVFAQGAEKRISTDI